MAGKSKSSITVIVPDGIMRNLTKFQELQKNVLGKLGCRACTSGFDINWLTDEAFVVNPKTLDVNPAGM